MPQSSMVQSVLKALDILQLTAKSPDGMRLNEIAEALDMKKTTAHNLIRSLRARGFLEKDAANRFAPGPALQALSAVSRRHTLLERVEKQFKRLSARFPLTVITFTELTPSSIQTRLRMSPDRPGEMQHPRERVVMPYITPTAVCLQATATNAGAYERNFPFEEYGLGYWGSPEKFLAAKRQVHQCGYFSRAPEGRLAMAFAIPENYVLGISMDQPPPGLPDELIEAAAEFKNGLAESL